MKTRLKKCARCFQPRLPPPTQWRWSHEAGIDRRYYDRQGARAHLPGGVAPAAGRSHTPQPHFRGRDAQIGELVAATATPGARILVQGISGVGKDTLVQPFCVSTLPRLASRRRIQASTSTYFRRQLLDLLAAAGPLLRGATHP